MITEGFKQETIRVVEFDTDNILSLDYVKNYLRVDDDCDDAFIKNAIHTAVLFAESLVGQFIINRNIEMCFLIDNPVNKIVFKKYFFDKIDEIVINDVLLTQDDFEIEKNMIKFKQNQVGNVKINFTTNIKNDKQDLYQAILFHIFSIFKNKDGSCKIPEASLEIYNMYRVNKLGL